MNMAVNGEPENFVRSERLATTLMDLINVPSPTGGEKDLAELLQSRFASMGLRSWLQEVEPDEPNVVATLEGSGDGPTLLFVGHLDTTWSGNERGIRDRGPRYKPIAERDGDWVYGMGAYNMKCGIAATVEAIQAVLESNIELLGDIVIAGVVGESPKAQTGRFSGSGYRGAGKGARHLVTNGVVADFCVVPESTSGQISTASGGYVYMSITTTGHPGATYVRRGTVGVGRTTSAIEAMNTLLAELEKWGDSYVASTNDTNGVPTHYSVVSVEGGLPYRPTKEAPFCEATIEIGVRPGDSLVGVVEAIRDVVRTSGVEGASACLIQAVPGAYVPDDSFIVQALRTAHSREYGGAPPLTCDGWLADTTHLTRYGIPAVCYSTAGSARHGGKGYYPSDGEQCYIPELTRGARVFTDLMATIGRTPRGDLPTTHTAKQSTIVL